MIEDYPRSLLDLERRFSTERSCRQYLFELRWRDGFRCPRCGGDKVWHPSRARLHCTGCRHQTTVAAGTIFDRTRKPLVLWFGAIWYLTSQKHGTSALGLQRVLGLGSYETALDLAP